MQRDRLGIERHDAVQPAAVGIDRFGPKADQRKVVAAPHAGHEIPDGKNIVAGSFEQPFQNGSRRVDALAGRSAEEQIVH
jgi:hypothetical protein